MASDIATTDSASDEVNSAKVGVLAAAAFLSGLCSIVYEILIATTASYFLGDGVLYFSLTIGFYMAAMGAGTYLSRFIDANFVAVFGWGEISLSLLGGLCVPLLYAAYALGDAFQYCYFALTVAIGLLIGLEIPFLARLMEPHKKLKSNLASVLSLDYLGALCATLALPLVLLPLLGVYQSSIAFGIVNLGIAALLVWKFGTEMMSHKGALKFAVGASLALLLAALAATSSVLATWEQSLYADRIIHSEQSAYQKIILTKDKEDLRLYLDGNLQFSSIDEYRYHEALVVVPMALSSTLPKRVLLLGAGDGLAAKLLLAQKEIQSITIVDLDPAVTQLAARNPHLKALNDDSLSNAKVRIINDDAFAFLRETMETFDLIIADLPDPNATALAKLYSQQFYVLARQRLSAGGFFVTQATSPYFAPKAFWSIAETVKSAGFSFTVPYHAYVPSFGDWGFVVASDAAPRLASPVLPQGLKFLSDASFPALFLFDQDVRVADPDINTIDQPIILTHYLGGWQRYK